MGQVITIVFPAQTNPDTVDALQNELRTLDEVVAAGSAATRSIDVANLALWVGLAADTASVAAVAAAVLMKIIGRVRAGGVQGAVIELPNRVRISIDSASPEDIAALMRAWITHDTPESLGSHPQA